MSSNFKPPGSDSDFFRQLWMKSQTINTANPQGATSDYAREGAGINPLNAEFPTKCVRVVPSEFVLRRLLQHYAHSSDVMVAQYSQENCTACNAMGKVLEYLCHRLESHYPRLHFYEIQKERLPEATRPLLRYPQIKGFSQGQWVDLDWKPPAEYTENVYRQVESHVHAMRKKGQSVTALQAEEMYFSVSAPAMTVILEESLSSFYSRTQAHLHNYWKQVSKRRSWYFKKYLSRQDTENKTNTEATSDGTGLLGESCGL